MSVVGRHSSHLASKLRSIGISLSVCVCVCVCMHTHICIACQMGGVVKSSNF